MDPKVRQALADKIQSQPELKSSICYAILNLLQIRIGEIPPTSCLKVIDRVFDCNEFRYSAKSIYNTKAIKFGELQLIDAPANSICDVQYTNNYEEVFMYLQTAKPHAIFKNLRIMNITTRVIKKICKTEQYRDVVPFPALRIVLFHSGWLHDFCEFLQKHKTVTTVIFKHGFNDASKKYKEQYRGAKLPRLPHIQHVEIDSSNVQNERQLNEIR